MKTAFAAAAMPHPHPQVLGACRAGLHDLGNRQEGPSSQWGPGAVGVVGEASGQEAPTLSLEAEWSLPRPSWEGAAHSQRSCPFCHLLPGAVPPQPLPGTLCGPQLPPHRSLVHPPHH